MIIENSSNYIFLPTKKIKILNISGKRVSDFQTVMKEITVEFVSFCEKLTTFVKYNTLYFWTRTAGFLFPNIIQKKRGVWKYSDLSWCENKSNSFIHTGKNGEFYSGFSLLKQENVFNALDYSRKNSQTVLFFTDEKIDERFNQFLSNMTSDFSLNWK